VGLQVESNLIVAIDIVDFNQNQVDFKDFILNVGLELAFWLTVITSATTKTVTTDTMTTTADITTKTLVIHYSKINHFEFIQGKQSVVVIGLVVRLVEQLVKEP